MDDTSHSLPTHPPLKKRRKKKSRKEYLSNVMNEALTNERLYFTLLLVPPYQKLPMSNDRGEPAVDYK